MGFHTFGPLLVIDSVTLAPSPGVVGTVQDADTLAPVQAYTMSGAPTTLVTNARGYVGQFQAPDTSARLRVTFGDLGLDVVAQEVIDATGDVAGAVSDWMTANPPTNPAIGTTEEVAAGTSTTKVASLASLSDTYAGLGANSLTDRQYVFQAETALPVDPSTHRSFDSTIENRNTTAPATTSTLVTEGVRSRIQHGSASVDAKGSNLALTGIVEVVGAGQTGNEHAALFGVVRVGSTTKAANGRVWVADLGAHSPIGPLGGVQPELLTGVTSFLNNYYDGDPVDGPSVAFAAVTKAGAGPASTGAGHDSADTYPLGIGLAVVGQSHHGGTDDLGWERGIQVGGYASGWMASGQVSRLGVGLYITDYTQYGIHIPSSHSTVPAAPAARFGRNVEIDNTVAVQGFKADGTTKTALLAVNSSDEAVFGASTATSVLFGSSVRVQTAGGTMLTFGSSSLAVGDGKNLSLGTTTGTQVGTATTQKLGFYGATPVVKPTGVAVTAEGIHAALVTLGLVAA